MQCFKAECSMGDLHAARAAAASSTVHISVIYGLAVRTSILIPPWSVGSRVLLAVR
jgi:hypothetical protein